MTYHNAPNGLSKIEKDWQKEYSGGCGVTGTLSHCWCKYTWYLGKGFSISLVVIRIPSIPLNICLRKMKA